MTTSKNNTDQVKVLSELMQLDMDAIEAYDQALKKIETSAVHKNIESFKQDHVKHVDDLSALIEKLGGSPPSRGKDIKGFLIKGMTAIRSLTGEESALKAMRSNEELTNKSYKEALKCDFSKEAKELVEKNYEDEKRHLAYIKSTLKEMS